MPRPESRRRWLIVGAALVAVVVVVCVVIGFTVPPAANTGGLPRSITVDGVAYDQVDLVRLRTPRQGSVTVQVPVTSRPVVVRASCRLAVLRASRARSALRLGMWWMRSGGSVADIPDTQGAEMLVCRGSEGPDLMQSIDPAWLPRVGDRLQLRWQQLDSVADTPSNSAASWALGVYTAG